MSKKREQLRAPLRAAKRQAVAEPADDASAPLPPLDNQYAAEVQALQVRYPNWKRFFLSEELHGEWMVKRNEIEEATHKLVEKFAWAVPDDRALDIVANFSPLIEIGAGKGYWARLLQGRGIDVIPFDKFLPDKEIMWTPVRRGGPEVLSKSIAKGRTLFLCYPDEAESMASICLEHYTGEYIVHVGELLETGTLAGPPVAPFGRTSSADFQVSLAETFHCVLVAELQGRLPISRDCISVWKRTKFVAGEDTGATVDSASVPITKEPKKGKSQKSKKTDSKAPPSGGGVEFVSAADLALLREAALDMQYSEDQDNRWAVVPEDEALPVDRAAPLLQHLLLKK